MAANRLSQAVHDLCQIALRTGEGLSDGQLLDHFIEHRDQAAFAALMRRHGPVVWGVCRRVVGHHQDAEDAYQATFLVLARKAVGIRPRHMVGNWLYGVAHRIALKAKAVAGRRRGREKQLMTLPEPPPALQPSWRGLEPLLDQELARLPDKYRVAIVLCDLENRTGKEVARHLKIPEGTLASRLRTGRALLAKRLARHGLMLAGETLALALSQNGATAGAPSAIISATIKAAPAIAAGQAVAKCAITPTVAALTEGVLNVMLLSKAKVIVGALLVMGVIGTGGLVSFMTSAGAQTGVPVLSKAARAQPPSPTDPKQTKKDEPLPKSQAPADPLDSLPGISKNSKLLQEFAELSKDGRAILKSKRDAAKKVWDIQISRIVTGTLRLDSVILDWHKRWLDAELELANGPKERLALLRDHWVILRKLEEDIMAGYLAGTVFPALPPTIRYYRLGVESAYIKEKAKPGSE